MINELTHQKCTKCGKVKPLSEFWKDKSRKNGYRSECACCSKENYLLHRKEYKKEYAKKYWKKQKALKNKA